MYGLGSQKACLGRRPKITHHWHIKSNSSNRFIQGKTTERRNDRGLKKLCYLMATQEEGS